MDISKEELICRFNALHVDGMAEITDLNLLPGSYINLEYTLPNGQKVKLLKDEATYHANQSHHQGTHRCYGLVAGEGYLLVCEYDDGGENPEIVVYQKL